VFEQTQPSVESKNWLAIGENYAEAGYSVVVGGWPAGLILRLNLILSPQS